MSKKNSKIGKRQTFIIDVEPYSQQCIVIVNGVFGDATKLLKKQKTIRAKESVNWIEKNQDRDDLKPNHKPKEGGGYLYTQLPCGYVMMFGHGNESWIDVVGLVVHESTHLAHYVLNRAGLTLGPDSEEAYTYLIEKITEEILRKIY